LSLLHFTNAYSSFGPDLREKKYYLNPIERLRIMNYIKFNPSAMKKILLLPFLTFFVLFVNGQTPVPNGNFESWTEGTYNLPNGYPISSDPSTFFRTPTAFNVTRTTDAEHGTYAVQITTTLSAKSDTVFAYLVPIQPNGSPTTWHGGLAYNQMATGIRGYYKYNLATADSGTILIAFSKGGTNIGTYIYTLGGNKSSYTLFNFTFKPALVQTPDSVIFAALSCKFTAASQQPKATAAGSLFLDSISFTGVASQPALFNGDFENWTSHTVALPDNWYYNGDDQGDGVYKSTDAEAGLYALELKTYKQNNNSNNQAQGGQINNVYYDISCKCQRGGIPFANQIDTLAFYYKYTPMANDSAFVHLDLKKNGSGIWGYNTYLHAAATYQYKEMYINAGQVPDTANIQIQSSDYPNSDLSFVGSDLIIDDMHFKSMPVSNGILNKSFKNEITIYPNPTAGILRIQDSGFKLQRLEIYNIQGKMVYSCAAFKTQTINEIDISTMQKGIYFVKMIGADKNSTEKIVIQ
jgi:hypothetical protein